MRVFHFRKRHVEAHDVLRPEARIHLHQLDEAANEQTGADQKHDGERHLANHQCAASSLRSAPPARATPILLQHLTELGLRRVQAWHQSERQSGHQRDDHGEGEHA